MNAKPEAEQNPAQSPTEPSVGTPPVAPSGGDQALDAIEDIDFLLQEIESKIAPLALA